MTGQSVSESDKAVKLWIWIPLFLLSLPFMFFSPPFSSIGFDDYDLSAYKIKTCTKLQALSLSPSLFIHVTIYTEISAVLRRGYLRALMVWLCDFFPENWLKLVLLCHFIGNLTWNCFQIKLTPLGVISSCLFFLSGSCFLLQV